MGTLLNRRRYMGGVSSPYDQFGYIKKGKIFHLDGIDKGSTNDVWTDLVGGITFAKVNGITFEDDHIVTTTSSDIMSGSSSIAIPYQSCTLEIVLLSTLYNNNYRVAFHGGTSNSLVCAHRNRNIVKTSPLKTTMIADIYENVKHTLSYTNTYGYCDGAALTFSNSDNVNTGASVACIGSRGGSSPNKFSGNIYAIRAYNRLLSAEEMLHNQSIDNERFNLGLTI